MYCSWFNQKSRHLISNKTSPYYFHIQVTVIIIVVITTILLLWIHCYCSLRDSQYALPQTQVFMKKKIHFLFVHWMQLAGLVGAKLIQLPQLPALLPFFSGSDSEGEGCRSLWKSPARGGHITRAYSWSFLLLPALVWNVLRRDVLKCKFSVSGKSFTFLGGGFAKERKSVTWMYVSINNANTVSHLNYFKCVCVWTDEL